MGALSAESKSKLGTYLAGRGLASPGDIDLFGLSDDAVRDAGLELAHVKQARRLHNLARDGQLADKLDARGLTSAFQIANQPKSQFRAEHADALGLDGAAADALHDRASRLSNRTMQLFASVRGAVASPFARATRASTVGADQITYFENLPSYQSLFGSLNYCAGEHCKSIFGPAAYFVDLMRIIDSYVTRPNSATIDTAFLLKSRRPDLWDIPLTCEATNDVFPALEIINSTLMAAVRSASGLTSDDAVLKQMATTAVYPRNLPFNDPLDRIRVLCQQAKLTLGDVYDVWKAGTEAVVRERLTLSPERAAIVTTPATTPAKVATFYNVAAAALADLAKVSVFLTKTGLVLPDLQALIVQGLTAAEIAAKVPANLFINQGLGANVLQLKDAGDDTAATIVNLNATALDQINRLLRLSEALGWSVPATDWALRAVRNGAAPIIDAAGLAGVQRAASLSRIFSLPPMQAVALFGPIKTYGGDTNAPGTPSPFDALFNSRTQVAQFGLYQPSGNPLNSLYASTPLTWTPGGTDADSTAAITRVAPGLDLALTALNALGLALFDAKPVKLTVDVLSALYRHALLSRAFNLAMDDYLLFLTLNGAAAKQVFTGPDLDQLVGDWQWLTTSGLTVYTIGYVTTGLTSVYVDPLYKPANVSPWLVSLKHSILDPTGPAVDQAIAQQLAVFFNADPTMAGPCLTMALAAVRLPAGITNWPQAFLALDASGNPRYPDYVADVVGRQSRWLVLAKAAALSASLLTSLATYPAAYGLPTNFDAITWSSVRGIVTFAGLEAAFNDVGDDLIAYVRLTATGAPLAERAQVLAAATGWPAGQIGQLLGGVAAGSATTVAQMVTLKACFDQITAFGADTGFMTQLAGTAALDAAGGWTSYKLVADLVQAKISARLGQTLWAQVAVEVEGQLQVHLRDALLGLELTFLNATYPDVTTPNNVYEFLLTDVETGPEAQLSVLKEGLNAAQLYLQRCRLRLEPGVETLDIPPVWWTWLLDYRVWEANRRIFVYPENYLLPSLRQDQTSLFKTLADDLQQSEITAKYVDAAYGSYLTNFASIAALKPVDTYRSTIDDPQRGKIKALYVLARTDTAPYTFYFCRQLDSAPWSEWREIDLQISSPYVTPVYAFSRLFIFWVELKAVSAPNIQVGATGGQTNNDIVYQATLKYSFQNHQDAWVQAQTLAEDVTVLFKGQGADAIKLAADPLFANDWDMQSMPWRRLTALRLQATNRPGDQVASTDVERIVIGLGPYVANVSTQNLKPDTSAPANPAAQAFVEGLVDRVWDSNRVVFERLSGEMTVTSNWVLDANLEISFLGHDREFLLVDPYRPAAPLSQFRPNLDDLSRVLQIVPTSAPISADNFADSDGLINVPATAASLSSTAFASVLISSPIAVSVFNALVAAKVLSAGGQINVATLASLDLNDALSALLEAGSISENQLPDILAVLFVHVGSPVLFSSVLGTGATVAGVKNQPGWFKLEAGGESFLLQPAAAIAGSPGYSTINEGVLQSPPLLNANSFVLKMLDEPIDAKLAGQIYFYLDQYGIIDEQGVVDIPNLKADTVVKALANLKLSDDRLDAITAIVFNRPVIYDTDFINDRINAAASRKIYEVLQSYAIIDDAQRLHLEILTSQLLARALANMLANGEILPRDVSTIYRTLVESPEPVNLSYWNKLDTSGFTTLAGIKFQVTRLTTAAIGRLNRAYFTGGIEQLLSLRSQAIPVAPVLPFSRLSPTGQIVWPSAIDGAQVDFDGLYGQYFWELYYHGPMLVANSLAEKQQFRDAIDWFQYIFDPTVKEQFVTPTTFATETNQVISPTASQEAFRLLQQNAVDGAPILSKEGRVNPKFLPSTSLAFLPPTINALQQQMIRNVLLNFQLATPAAHYWMFRPFRMHTLESLKYMLSDSNPAVLAYEDDPFNPFAIARLRIGAFEKATLMQYIDTLMDWGDSYFALGTWESITAATMLYVYASNLLGPRPQQVGECGDQPPTTFGKIQQHYGNSPIPVFLIDLESTLAPVGPATTDPVPIESHAFNDLGAYFCVPENDVLIGYWDRVEAQLYKIRHSLDINGNFRLLALFEPPLDPMALVKAAGSSNNFLPSSGGSPSPTPPNRFEVVLARARALAATAGQFGQQLQGALERRDGEALEVLRNTFEGQLLALSTQIQSYAIDRQNDIIAGLIASQAGAKAQLDHYTNLLNTGLISSETTNIDAMGFALGFNLIASGLETASAIAYTIPQVGSPFAMTYGGIQIGSALSGGAAAAKAGSEIATYIGQRSLTMAGYERRAQEWTIARANAQHEYDALTRQIAAARDDLAAAVRQLDVHNLQREQSRELRAFLTAKFSNQALYQWIAGRLSGLYYQTYRLAMQAAVAAQAAYRYETDSTRSFINFDYWDPTHAGLLASEGLMLALDLMEASYAETNQRRLEIERTISIAGLDPVALDTLRQTGSCQFTLPELLFDYDYPGHYCRRIKSVSISIPAIVGPYQNIKATLTQTNSYVAVTPALANVTWLVAQSGEAPATVWKNPNAGNQQIAVSRSIDDNGLFVLNFEDPRYLPFEGSGAVSDWRLDMPRETNRIDFNQLSDVVLTVRYTALSDGTLATGVKGLLKQNPLTAGYYVDIARSFATPWQAFLQNHSTTNVQALRFDYAPGWLGTLKSLTLANAALRFTPAAGVALPTQPFTVGTLAAGSQTPVPITLDDLGLGSITAPRWTLAQMTGTWSIALDLAAIRTHWPAILKGDWIDPSKLKNIEMLLACTVTLY